jgi:hypothetical protein
MKTFLPLKKTTFTIVFLMILVFAGISSHSQELVFKNSTHESGTPAAGSDLCVYRFPSVANNIDALVKINGRSSSLVRLINIDVTSSGFDRAFQPQIDYNNGAISSARSWWMEFTITFVNKNTTTPISITTFNATALDIDGDNNKLHEWVSFFSPNSYTLENPTNLSVSNLLQSILGILTNVGKTFDGITNDHSGIDTSATDLMTTARYNNVSSITYRIGATTTGASGGTQRNYALYFKNFAYSSPIISLPVKLISFTAALNQNQTKVDLKWSTASEMNVSHFVIEKSYDGKTFNDAAVMFAYGNTTEKRDYSFADNANGNHQVIYYRLRSVDNDSKTQLSETRVVRLGKQTETLKIVTYPNPVTSELKVTLPFAWQGKAVVVELFNQNGQRVKAISTGSASQTETMIVSDLSEGLYLLKASNGIEMMQQKVIKK